ncbi:MAG: response regulator transcription factor [Clostridiales bacterium]|nr:response regulator transcription factor [Lachnospiraceae bacterium]MBR5358923.1 response regulator transcription factor [Clostridiales bacterium]
MLKCTICDDNSQTVSDIHDMICRLFPDRFVYKFAFGTDDFEDNDCADCDVLIIDIDLDNSDGVDSGGIEIAGRIKENKPDVQVIFVSAFHEYAQDIFRADPVYYLQKPVSESKLKVAVDKALSVLEHDHNDKFTYVSGSDIVSIPMREILFFESDKRRMNAVTNGNKQSFYSRVKDVETELDDRFIRCHQSFIVNMDHVSSMRKDNLLLDDGSAVPVSQSRRKEVRIALTKHLGRKLV